MALAGRTEEQIKLMGNWSSFSVASRYIATSEVTKFENGRAVAGCFSSAVTESSVSSVRKPLNPDPPVPVVAGNPPVDLSETGESFFVLPLPLR